METNESNKVVLLHRAYQINAEGYYKNFDGKGKYSSKEIYLSEPTEQQINTFIDHCCNSDPDDAKSIFDLDEKNIKIKILNVNIVGNKIDNALDYDAILEKHGPEGLYEIAGKLQDIANKDIQDAYKQSFENR